MSTQTATMSDAYPSPVNPFSFLRKLVVLLSFVVGIVAFMALFDFYQNNLPDILMMVFAVASIGLSIGIGSRTVFYENSGLVRTLVAFTLLPLALYAIGFLSNWRIGIGPLGPWLEGLVDWSQLAQLIGGFFVTILALTAWWRPAASSDEMLPDYSPNHREQPRITPAPQQSRFKLPQVKSIRLHFPESWTRPRESARVRTRTNRTNHRSRGTTRNRPDVAKLVVARPEKPVRPKRRRSSRRKPELQFSVHEEHRCPYCLDEVKRNDPRGVKECEICHSWHHADCWNITGMCQVPHLNT
jgi:hypothetical protein